MPKIMGVALSNSPWQASARQASYTSKGNPDFGFPFRNPSTFHPKTLIVIPL